MTTKITTVELSQAIPGMILATPVCDSAGISLLLEGAELTAPLLASLARRGVARVQVQEVVQLSPEELAAQRALVTARLDYLFRNGDDRLMAVLHETVLDYRLENLQ